MHVVATNQRAQAKRDQIRSAAEPLFVRDGFAGTTTDAIAAAAGVSKQTLYRHYPSKEDLLLDILFDLTVRRAWSDDATTTQPVRSRAALEAALMGVAFGIVEHTTDSTFLGLERALITEIPRFPNLARQFQQMVIEPGFAIVLSILQRAHAAGVVRVPPSETEARLFLGAMLSYVFVNGLLTADEDRKPPDPAQVRALVLLFLDAMT